MQFKYLFFNGKGFKPYYYLARYIALMTPNFIYRQRRRRLLAKFEKMPQSRQEYIMNRVNYYCKLDRVEGFTLANGVSSLREHKLSNREKRGYASVYFFDTYEYVRSLPQHLKWAHIFGDVDFIAPIPSITKSRPIGDDNQNSVILKLNKLRHFICVDDTKSFEQKDKVAVFRGNIVGKQCRVDFVEKFHNSTLCDAKDVSTSSEFPCEWKGGKMTLPEQLDYKFILSLEGNDVASNLKWIMSSNSVAVMPRPTCETWFMEGRLIPDFHYIEVADDYSNFEERINYYLENPDKAIAIARNANKHWEQFLDTEGEDIISHLVLDKYFTQTCQR
ncbi:MAG: glycosyl transferase family 90 [Rikenellaceae bacterium]